MEVVKRNGLKVLTARLEELDAVEIEGVTISTQAIAFFNHLNVGEPLTFLYAANKTIIVKTYARGSRVVEPK